MSSSFPYAKLLKKDWDNRGDVKVFVNKTITKKLDYEDDASLNLSTFIFLLLVCHIPDQSGKILGRRISSKTNLNSGCYVCLTCTK
ncbi:hypothetical protein L596_017861 [Steinernema carpocapsae]|uniref:Uncharacterized protein n=1 Tax=Steinernema carpocapsae TaxID=34508 RepID=A0A4U5N377_STECR|nr:hypothetical protein L596_017861 [Steinernema carpocapsae]